MCMHPTWNRNRHTSRDVELRQMCDYVVDPTLKLWFEIPSPMKAWGQEKNGNCFAEGLDEGSCAGILGRRPKECIQRDNASGNLTQTLGEAQGSLLATGEDVAQVRVGAIGSLGNLPDRHFVGFGPAKHGVWF